MTKTEKQLRHMVNKAGLEVLGFDRSKHYKIRVRADDGRTTTITAAVTASDRRAVANQRARFSRFAKGSPL